MERYRRGFYMQLVTGRQAEQGPQRRGGVFGGAGLEGFSALGGGFGRLTTNQQNAGFQDTGTPGAGGYLGLLQQQLQIENQEENIARLRENLFRLEDTNRELMQTIPASQDILPTQQLQVAQARQALFIAQNNLITLSSQYEQQLDTFKRLMGLPPYLCVEIRDQLLERFKLITPPLKNRRVQLSDLRDDIGETNTRILNLSTSNRDPNTGVMVRSIAGGDALARELKQLQNDVAPMAQIRKQIVDSDIAAIMQDIANLRAAIPDRSRQLARLRDIAEREKGTVCRLLPLPQFDLSLLKDDDCELCPISWSRTWSVWARITRAMKSASKNSKITCSKTSRWLKARLKPRPVTEATIQTQATTKSSATKSCSSSSVAMCSWPAKT